MRQNRKSRRSKWANSLILLGVAVWLPYALLKYIVQMPVHIAPFLTLHLLGVIPGSLLKRGPEIYQFLQRKKNDQSLEKTL